MTRHAAVDLGASGGRVVVLELDGDTFELHEVHRFPNRMLPLRGHLHWDVYRLYDEILAGLREAGKRGVALDSIGVDTWGVDYALLDRDGGLVHLPYAYRDTRTDGLADEFAKRMPRDELYERTGVQFLPFNTLFQLFAAARQQPGLLERADRFLMLPDLFHFFLCGESRLEFSNATTTQCWNVHDRQWDPKILESAGIPTELFADPVESGTVLGELSPQLQEETGLGAVPIVAPATHDTASAFAAVPSEHENVAVISCGTWSLMGVELEEPNTSAAARDANFTNEGGVGGTVRFLKNINGLWLVQGIRADYDDAYDFEELTDKARDATPFSALIDPGHADFLNPASMCDAITAFCKRTGQNEPLLPGGFVRCALESLAFRYRAVLEELREVASKQIECIHLVGGGARNDLLCQFTADATGLPVIAGPAEATAIGNALVQARALGHLRDLPHLRAIVRNTASLIRYEPGDTDLWNEQRPRYQSLSAH